MFEADIPRKLKGDELTLLLRILPERKPGYKEYRELISSFYLVGKGINEGSYILQRFYDQDNLLQATPVFAAGTFLTIDKKIADITIHEEVDDCIEIEVEIKIADGIKNSEFKDVIYPEWEPGNRAPGDNSFVREVILVKGKFIIALAPVHKRVWLYEAGSGVNYFIGAGAFYNSLCFIRDIRERAIVHNPKLLFHNLDTYSDNDLISAFHLYNKDFNRFRIEIPSQTKQVREKGIFRKFIKKDKN